MTLSCGVKKRDSSVTDNEHAHESVDARVAPCPDDHRQKGECVQVSTGIDPPPRVKKRDGSLPPEAPQRTAPCKPLRRKEGGTRETPAPKTNNQQNLKATVSSALDAFDSVTPQPCERSSDVIGTLEPLQSIDKPCQTVTEMIPSQPARRKSKTTTSFVGTASLQADTEQVFSKNTE